METLRGRLLVSNGSLFDPNFRHTVVLIVEHGDDGALGLVLNRPAPSTVSESVPELAELVEAAENIYIGGPVQPEAAVILAEFDPTSVPDELLLANIGLVGEFDLEDTTGITRARVFGGYSGWGPGQLEDELERNDWFVEPAQAEDVFTSDPAHLWHQVLERKGGRFAMLARMPFDPSHN
jgi:putative transcriptional regulator